MKMMTFERLKKIIDQLLSNRLSVGDRRLLSEEEPFASLLKEQWDEEKEWHKIDRVDSQEIWSN